MLLSPTLPLGSAPIRQALKCRHNVADTKGRKVTSADSLSAEISTSGAMVPIVSG